jgi:hypothetical protein
MNRMAAAAACCWALTLSTPAFAQLTYRMIGKVSTEAGAPIDEAVIKAEAIAGFKLEPFGGQRTFTAKSNKKGEWSLVGLTSGVWLFQAHAPNMLPQAIVITVKMMKREGGTGGATLLPYTVEFALRPTTKAPGLASAAQTAYAGKKAETVSLLRSASLETAGIPVLIAAGEIALAVQEGGGAFGMFRAAATEAPGHWRAHAGLGSAALMLRDLDTAAKSYWTARDAAPEGLKQAIAATVADLQQIMMTR